MKSAEKLAKCVVLGGFRLYTLYFILIGYQKGTVGYKSAFRMFGTLIPILFQNSAVKLLYGWLNWVMKQLKTKQ